MNQSVPVRPFTRLPRRELAGLVGLVLLGVTLGLAVLVGVLTVAETFLWWAWR